jgi:hypothetical protein
MENQLTHSEKILLLAVRKEKGGISALYAVIDLMVAGAAFLEMAMAGNIRLIDGRAEILQPQTTVPLHQYLLDRMALSGNPRKIDHWLTSYRISMKRIKGEIYRSLVQKHEIRLEEQRFLFFRWNKPFLLPGNHVMQVIDRIKRVINQPSGSPEEIFLLLLTDSSGLLRRIYPERTMRKSARNKIKQFRESNLSSEPVDQSLVVVKAVQKAMAVRRAATVAAS